MTILAMSTIAMLDTVRPGLLEALSEYGQISGGFMTIADDDYQVAMQPFPELLGIIETRIGRSSATIRTLPVDTTEAERCRYICHACSMFDANGLTCLDKTCGCYRSESRREPWLNRPTQCRYWLEKTTF